MVYLLRSVELLFWWRHAIDDAAYMNVVIAGDGANELFKTTEIVGKFRLFRRFMLVYHSGLDISNDLVEISSFISTLMGFNKMQWWFLGIPI